MATKIVEMKTVESNEEGREGSPFVLLFELEGVAVQGRKIEFDVIKSILGEQGLDVTPISFSRYCLYPSPEHYLQELLDSLGSKASSQKLLEDVNNGIAMHLAARETTLNAGVSSFIEAAKASEIQVGTFSGLPVATAESLSKKLGLDDLGVQLFTHENVEKNFPRADFLLKVAKSLSASPRYCVAIASSHSTCKSALSAGMRCIAAPDEFTSFQDFGGAEVVVDNLAETDAKALLDSLCPVING